MIEFEDYKTLTFDTLASINKSKLLMDFSIKTFEHFPDNIHQNAVRSLGEAMRYIVRKIEAVIKGDRIEERSDIVIDGDKHLNKLVFLARLNGEQKIQISSSNLNRYISYKEQILEQNLVYAIGITEGYLYDTVKIIYQNNPKHLADHDLSMNFKDLIDIDNTADLFKEMTELAVGRTWSEGNFSERMGKLRTKFEIILSFKKNLKELLDEANLIRNCILHNGSKVSSDYYDKFGDKRKLTLGEPIVLSQSFCDAIYYLSLDFIELLFVETSNIAWIPSLKSHAKLYKSQ